MKTKYRVVIKDLRKPDNAVVIAYPSRGRRMGGELRESHMSSGTLYLPPKVYDRAVALARWQQSIPKEIILADEDWDGIGEVIQNLLMDFVPHDLVIFDVETSQGAAWLIVLNSNDEEKRIRLRRKSR